MLLGINIWDSYQVVLLVIYVLQCLCDLIVVIGDLVQDYFFVVYQYFVEGIVSFVVFCVWLLGNYDFQLVMYSILQEVGIFFVKCVFFGDCWQILLFDSQVFGVFYGELSDFQLEWFEYKLVEVLECYILFLLYYYLLLVGCSWLDQYSLCNVGVLDSVLSVWLWVKYFLCGYIYQELDFDWNGWCMMVMLLICVQFKLYCVNFILDMVLLGWCWLEFYFDGMLIIEVCCLEGVVFYLDIVLEGY